MSLWHVRWHVWTMSDWKHRRSLVVLLLPPALRGFSSGGGGVGYHSPTLFQFDDGCVRFSAAEIKNISEDGSCSLAILGEE